MILLLNLDNTYAALTHSVYFEGYPDREQLKDWSTLGPISTWVFNVGELRKDLIQDFQKAIPKGLVRLELKEYPHPRDLALWQNLANQGVQFVGLNIKAPTDQQIQTLNSIGFKKIILVFRELFSKIEYARLNAIQSELALTIDANRLPLFSMLDDFRAIPPNASLLFAADFWPWYSHMDAMNIWKRSLKIRVHHIFPFGAGIEYLNHVKTLEEMGIVTDYLPTSNDWSRLPVKPIHWTLQNQLPSQAAIEELLKVHPPQNIRMTVQWDGSLSEREKKQLEDLPFAVEWNQKIK